jgi:hypothetical protein
MLNIEQLNKKDIWFIEQFPCIEIEIDFGEVEDEDGKLVSGTALAQNEMVRLTEEVEKNSGIAKHFNKPENVGEGWVWTFQDERGNLQRWKTKGEEHSNSKVKKLKAVDSEKEQAKVDFANNVAKPFRLEQAWQTVFGLENEKMEPSMKAMGPFLKAVMADVIKEESDIMAERGLEPKDVGNAVNKIARGWFKEQLNSGLGL